MSTTDLPRITITIDPKALTELDRVAVAFGLSRSATANMLLTWALPTAKDLAHAAAGPEPQQAVSAVIQRSLQYARNVLGVQEDARALPARRAGSRSGPRT